MPDVATGAAWTPLEQALQVLARAVRGDAPAPGSVAGRDVDLSPAPPAPTAPAPTWQAQRPFLAAPPRATSGPLPRGTSPGLLEQAMLASQGALGVGSMDASDYSTPEGQATATRAGGVGELVGLLAPILGTVIKAYHGSPHDFEAFDFSKVGTGEGTQAFGHGGYFAQREAVAGGYRPVLELNDGTTFSADDIRSDPTAHAASVLQAHGGDVEKALGSLWDAVAQATGLKARSDFLHGAIDEMDHVARIGVRENPGRMYEVNIHADPQHLLDWDAPLQQQSAHVQAALQHVAVPGRSIETMSREELQNLLQQVDPNGVWAEADVVREFGAPNTLEELRDAAREMDLDEYLRANISDSPHASGQSLYRQLTAAHGGGNVWSNPAQATVSAQLEAAGIPGIKYLDRVSRAGGGDVAGATRNYVIFNPAIVEIAKKYGIALPVAAALYHQQQAGGQQ